MLELLERQNKEGSGISGDGDLAERAASLLGYERLKQSLVPKGENTTLGTVFAKLDVCPFTPESVRWYKAAEAWRRTRFSRTRCVFVICCMVACALAVVAGLISLGVSGFGAIPLIEIVVGFFGAVLLGQLLDKMSVNFAEWKTINIATYGENIPEFVLETACRIKEEIPEAEFAVDVLVVNRIKWCDPFLVLLLRNQTYHLEVWNEPGFKKERQI